MPMRPQNGNQTGFQNGPQNGSQSLSQFGQGGQQTGTQTGNQTGTQTTGQQGQQQPDPTTQNTELATWLDEVIAAGGITADSSDITRLTHASDELTAIIDAGGTSLSKELERPLSQLARELRQVSQRGDSALTGTSTSTDSTATTRLGLAEERLEEFLESQGDLLSDEAESRLTSALTTIQTVYADGTVTTAERTSVGTAADSVCSVLKDSFVKLSSEGLADLQDQVDDLLILESTGFLALDDTQWDAVNAADTALAAGTSDSTGLHDALDTLRDALPDPILDLSHPFNALHQQAGGGSSTATLFSV